jgi:hypothetical protein
MITRPCGNARGAQATAIGVLDRRHRHPSKQHRLYRWRQNLYGGSAEFWLELQDRLGSADLQLVFLQENDPQQQLTDIIRARGPVWERYVVDAFDRYPWMKARGLSGVGGMLEMIGQYSVLTDHLVALWRFAVLSSLHDRRVTKKEPMQ